MTQTEAVVEALKILGGKAELKYIYMVAIDLIGEHNSNNIWANIRRCLYSNPKLFYPLKEKGDGWWGLVSYQNELDKRDARIVELEAVPFSTPNFGEKILLFWVFCLSLQHDNEKPIHKYRAIDA